MKKQFTILLILVFVLGLTPLNFSEAITQNQIDAEVQIVCTDGSDNWFSGSGTIIDPKGIILTNRHVVEGAYMNTCFIGFIESISQEPNFGTSGNYNLAEVKYQTVSNDMDAAILYLDNPTNKIYPYINIWDSNSDALQFGDKIEVIGFPSIGGSTITYTSGDFSGFGSSADGTQNYIKSTAPLEHGNSGGASYNPSGQFIGIPTMVVAGTLNSLSYVLSVNSIKDWLGGILGNQYQDEIIQQTPTPVKPTVSLQNDVTPPFYNQQEVGIYQYDSENELQNYISIRNTTAIYEFPKISFDWDQDCFGETRKEQLDVCIRDNESSIAGYYYYFGPNPNAIPKIDGDFISADSLSADTHFKLPNSVKLPIVFIAQEGKNYFILQAKDTSNNVSNPIINIEYIYEQDSFKDIKSFTIQNQNKDTIGVLTYPARDTWGYEAHVVETNQPLLILCPDYEYKIDGLIYYISYQADNFWYDKTREGIITSDKCITVNNFNGKGVTNLFIKPNTRGVNSFLGKHHILTIHYQNSISNSVQPANKMLMTNHWEEWENSMTFQAIDTNLLNRLKGKILLQVEQNGEAYYVYPDDSRKYYLGRPADAFDAMRKLGLGATHQFINSHTTYPDHVLGKILIDVEQNGEAYYIYPKDKKAYYLGRPADAFRIMRELGLGITNSDLSKIPEGSL